MNSIRRAIRPTTTASSFFETFYRWNCLTESAVSVRNVRISRGGLPLRHAPLVPREAGETRGLPEQPAVSSSSTENQSTEKADQRSAYEIRVTNRRHALRKHRRQNREVEGAIYRMIAKRNILPRPPASADPEDYQSDILDKAKKANLDVPSRMRTVMRSAPQHVVLITACDPTKNIQEEVNAWAKPSPELDRSISRWHAATVSSFTPVTLKPLPQVSFNLRIPSRTFDAIQATKLFWVHFLVGNSSGASIAHLFATGEAEAGFRMLPALGCEVQSTYGGPVIMGKGVKHWLLCRLRKNSCVTVGDHVIVVAEVRALRDNRRSGNESHPGLMYLDQHYRSNFSKPPIDLLPPITRSETTTLQRTRIYLTQMGVPFAYKDEHEHQLEKLAARIGPTLLMMNSKNPKHYASLSLKVSGLPRHERLAFLTQALRDYKAEIYQNPSGTQSRTMKEDGKLMTSAE